MTMPNSELEKMAIARLAHLAAQKNSAIQIGDVALIEKIDSEISEVSATLAVLKPTSN